MSKDVHELFVGINTKDFIDSVAPPTGLRLRFRLLTTYYQILITCKGTHPVLPSQCISISVEVDVYLVRAPESYVGFGDMQRGGRS